MSADPTVQSDDLPTREQLARDVFALARKAEMPQRIWMSNARIARACAAVGVSPAAAWDEHHPQPDPQPDPQAAAPPVLDTSGDPVEVWTDGACRHNPGPGGWGWVTTDGREGFGAEPDTTNQRMEVLAAFEAVRSVPDRPLVVVSDSTYVVNCFNQKWWAGWLKRGWTNSQGKPVANRDLWEPLIDLVVFGGVSIVENPHRVPVETGIAWRWVKGHAGHPLNERADALAVAARETLSGGRSRTRA